MGLGMKDLKPCTTPIYGFIWDSVHPLRMIELPLTTGERPKQVTVMATFIVVESLTAFNAVLGRPSLYRLKANVREEEVHAEPNKETEEVLISEHPLKVLKIGKGLYEDLKCELKQYLVGMADVFAWRHENIVGISPTMMSHYLNIDPLARPVRQKRRALDSVRYVALKEEVDKLDMHRSIQEAFYPVWVSNLVLVPKPNGKWRIPMNPVDEEHTSFITDKGLYCYRVMPFGLKNAKATYHRFVNKIFANQIGRNMEVYVDDMLVKSK
ncbi:hypothetical protein CsatB_001015 [Cannabis sativa]